MTASTRKAKKMESIYYLNTLSNHERDSVLKSIKHLKDDGSPYTTAFADSIFGKAHFKETAAYTTVVYRDTLSNQFYYILHKRSADEMDADTRHSQETFAKDEENRKKLKGSVVNDLVMTDTKGNRYTSETLKDKVIILDFWFTTCAACIKEMPDLNKIKEDFGTDEVAYFGVTYDEKATVERFLGKVKYDFTPIADSRNLCEKFGIQFYPTTLVIDKKGKVVYTGDFFDLKEKPNKIRKLLKKLTSGKKVNVVSGPIEKQD